MPKLIWGRYLDVGKLGRGWHDVTNLLLEVPFKLLVDFVEKEKPGEKIDWDATPEHKHAWDETLALYEWWTKTRPARHDPLDDLPLPPLHTKPWEGHPGFSEYIPPTEEEAPGWQAACEESSRLELEWDKEDAAMLHRLIDIRGYLWT